jgi:hypothetical protein
MSATLFVNNHPSEIQKYGWSSHHRMIYFRSSVVICIAIACGNMEVVKKLLERGAISRASVVEEVNPKA